MTKLFYVNRGVYPLIVPSCILLWIDPFPVEITEHTNTAEVQRESEQILEAGRWGGRNQKSYREKLSPLKDFAQSCRQRIMPRVGSLMNCLIKSQRMEFHWESELLSWETWNNSEFMNHCDLRPPRPKEHLPYLSSCLEEEEQMRWEGSPTLPESHTLNAERRWRSTWNCPFSTQA